MFCLFSLWFVSLSACLWAKFYLIKLITLRRHTEPTAQPLEAIPWPEMWASHQLQKAGSISCVDELLWKAFCNFPVPWKYEQIILVYYPLAKNLQSSPWGRSAPPPPSSCAQSEHRSGPAAPSDPCSDVSSGCPAGRINGSNIQLCKETPVNEQNLFYTGGLLTSKSTFSPSGIFGAVGLRESVGGLSVPAH